MLVFKDSIALFQPLSANMLKVGDWITMPKYGADGMVIEVTLNTVKIRNFDNTITTIPPYLLISDSFQKLEVNVQPWTSGETFHQYRHDQCVFLYTGDVGKYRKIQLLKDYGMKRKR